MKKLTICLPIFSLLFFTNCQDNGLGHYPETNNFYPAKLNMEWEYNTVTIIEYYDSLGNISEVDTTFSDNTVVRVVNVNDKLETYNNLIKFESYDLGTPGNKHFIWYSNSDSGLISIAYNNAGYSQLVYPKIKAEKYLTFEEYKSIINSPIQNLFSITNKAVSDTILFYEVPRKVLAYPLAVNKRWVELVFPWYRERFVDRTKDIFFSGQQLNCYVVKVDWPSFDNIEFNDYVSLSTGLVKREILADSIMITSITNPDSGMFGRVSTYSNLVRINYN